MQHDQRGSHLSSAKAKTALALRLLKYTAGTFLMMAPLVSTAIAKPKNVIITRHGDKPPVGNCLSLQGLERAAALAYYFAGTPLYNTPPISHIFAEYKGKENSSMRSVQTCAPTATHLKLPLNSSFSRKQIPEIAKEILTNAKYENSTVLVCWDHGSINELVQALGGEAPDKWEHDVFDQVFMLTYQADAKPKFQKILQKLMFGDRATFEDKPQPLAPISVKCPDKVL